jgi:hypothetical protein
VTEKKNPKKKVPNEPVFTIDLTTAMDDDWLRAARLKRKALAGDKEAQKELDRMENVRLVPWDELERLQKLPKKGK